MYVDSASFKYNTLFGKNRSKAVHSSFFHKWNKLLEHNTKSINAEKLSYPIFFISPSEM